jgi:hypothetical protein
LKKKPHKPILIINLWIGLCVGLCGILLKSKP